MKHFWRLSTWRLLQRVPTQVNTGTYQQTFTTGSLPNGNYTLRAIFNGYVYTKNIIKL